jgi:cyclohexyl-isocyanide hydratase
MLLYPGLTQLDLTGPLELFQRIPDSKVHLAWKTRDPVFSDGGFGLLPTTTLADVPPLDLLFVPGGGGQLALMADAEVLGFLRRQGEGARYVTSVCTGSLLLGAAGLLDGYRAATHWAYVDLLAAVGAIAVDERVVVDRNRITAGGVTAGIDFGLRIVEQVAGETFARRVQLALEYDPAPPFRSGHPRVADPKDVEATKTALRDSLQQRRAQLALAKEVVLRSGA